MQEHDGAHGVEQKLIQLVETAVALYAEAAEVPGGAGIEEGAQELFEEALGRVQSIQDEEAIKRALNVAAQLQVEGWIPQDGVEQPVEALDGSHISVSDDELRCPSYTVEGDIARCTGCSYARKRSDNVKRHYNTRHNPPVNTPCGFCSHIALTKVGLNTHISCHHCPAKRAKKDE